MYQSQKNSSEGNWMRFEKDMDIRRMYNLISSTEEEIISWVLCYYSEEGADECLPLYLQRAQPFLKNCDSDHVVEIEPFDEHPEEHGRPGVL